MVTPPELYPWRERAACKGLTDVMFIPPRRRGIHPGISDPEHRERTATAKAICARCPVRKPCLKDALTNNEVDGIWGGLTPAERAPLLRERRSERRYRQQISAAEPIFALREQQFTWPEIALRLEISERTMWRKIAAYRAATEALNKSEAAA